MGRTVLLASATWVMLLLPSNGHSSTADNEDAMVQLVSVLGQTLEGLDLAGLFTSPEGLTVEGVQGNVALTLFGWQFNQFSLDGQLVIDGGLAFDILASPITMRGALDLSGSQEGTAVVDLSVDDTDPENARLVGTITFKGEEFQFEELLEATAILVTSWGMMKAGAGR